MTRVTFGISSSCNMAVKRNALDLAHEYRLGAEAVEKSFYVDPLSAGSIVAIAHPDKPYTAYCSFLTLCKE